MNEPLSKTLGPRAIMQPLALPGDLHNRQGRLRWLVHLGKLQPRICFFEKRGPIGSCALFAILEGKHVYVVITVIFFVSLVCYRWI